MRFPFLNKSFSLSLIVILGFFFATSCKKFLEIPPPKTQAQTKEIFQNDQAAISAALGLYDKMHSNGLIITNGGTSLYGGLSSDEIYNTWGDADLSAFSSNSLLPNSQGASGPFWQAAYKNIYQANAVIEGLAASSGVTESVKKMLRGEMLVGRALNYFYMVNFFGDVPYITATNYQQTSSIPRISVSNIYQNMIADLQEARSLLSPTYPSAGRVRPNKWAATALLARIFLYQKDWANAELQSTEVINNSPTYVLVSNLDNVFLGNSKEAIWQLQPMSSGTLNTAEGVEFVPFDPSSTPNEAVTDFLLNAFEPNDQRKTKWLGVNNASGTTLYFPNKYKIAFNSTTTEYYIILRLAEQYLIRAEARAQLGNISGAASDLNTIRSRAGLPNTVANTQPQLLSAIEHERQVELFLEWGHRWLDLKRTGRINDVLGPEKSPNWQPTDALYPIPQFEIQTNPFLTQNPGY
jgi:hypothetical protein